MDEEEQDGDDDDDPMGTVHVWGNKCSNIVYFKVNSFVYSWSNSLPRVWIRSPHENSKGWWLLEEEEEGGGRGGRGGRELFSVMDDDTTTEEDIFAIFSGET